MNEKELASVVQKVDSAIHLTNSIKWKVQFVSQILIRCIVLSNV